MRETVTQPIVLYDGVCGLCNRGVQFLLRRDHYDRFRFASLQSQFAVDLLRRHGVDAGLLDTLYVVEDYQQINERLLTRSDAVIDLMKKTGGVRKIFMLAEILPRWARDRIYDLVARHRYRIFGKHESCLLPNERLRHKFLDQK